MPRSFRTRMWMKAAAGGKLTLAEALIPTGIDFRIALAFCTQYGPARLVRRLLIEARSRGADPNLRVDSIPLILVAHRSPIEPIEKRNLLTHAGARLDATVGARAWSLLGFAAYFGDAEFARFLLSRGVDPAIADRNGLTPVQMAHIGGRSELVDLLLSYGATDLKPRLPDIESLFISENSLWAQVHESLKGGVRLGGAELDRPEVVLEPKEGVDSRFRYFFENYLI